MDGRCIIQAVRSMSSMLLITSQRTRNSTIGKGGSSTRGSSSDEPGRGFDERTLEGQACLDQIETGESFAGKCDVGELCDLTKPGLYRITADYPGPESALLIRLNTVEITVSK